MKWSATVGGRRVDVRVETDAHRVRDVHAAWGAPGNPLGVALEAVCLAASVNLRLGVPLRSALRGMLGQRFEPAGETGDPQAPRCTSVADYVARSVLARFDGLSAGS